MQIFDKIPWDWIFLGLFLVFLAYAAWRIRGEKDQYLQEGSELQFWGLRFWVPGWWTPNPLSPKIHEPYIKFERTDTRYDWQAGLMVISPTHSDLVDEFKDLIARQNIIFDQETGIIHDPRELFVYPEIEVAGIEAVRIEGTATEDENDRLYYDAYLLRRKNNSQEMLFAYSKSSVLNGCVEGPYFEEMMKRIKLGEQKNRESSQQEKR